MPSIADPARALGAALAAGSALLLAACALSPFFRIERIAVGGAHHTTVDAVVSAAGLTGASTFSASAALARKQLLRLPAVRDAVVDIALPDEARITIRERVPIGRWIAGGLEWFVDSDGVVRARGVVSRRQARHRRLLHRAATDDGRRVRALGPFD